MSQAARFVAEDLAPPIKNHLVKNRTKGRPIWHAIRYTIERNKAAGMGRELLGAETARAHAQISEQHFRSLAEAIPQIVWETDTDGKFEYLSSRWSAYIGQPPHECAQLGMLDWIHPDDAERWVQARSEGARNKTAWQVEFRLRSATGSYRWFLGRSVPLLDGKGEVVRWYGTATDVDDQRRLAEERQVLYEVAQRAIKSRDDLLATIAHDLRNPLETILMSAALLKDDATESTLAPKVTKKIAIIERAAKRMEHLIRDLLDITSIESGHLSMRPTPVSAASLLSDAIEALQPGAQDKSVRIEMHSDPAPVVVACDRERILQVFTNLVGNAIRFSPAASVIVLATQLLPGGELVFSVADHGSGIAADQLSHVFDRFWHADERRAGLGLGLAICRGIIEQHGGRIWVESRLDVGTTFFFTLPVVSRGNALDAIGMGSARPV